MIVYVKAFSTEAARNADVDAIGFMPVSTLGQFSEALRVYAEPYCFLAFKGESGDDLGNRGRAHALLLSAINAAVMRQLSKFGSQGHTTAELAQVVGVPAKELATILNMLRRDGAVECVNDKWTLAKG